MERLVASIKRVMVAEDRAFVTRSVSLELGEGEHRFEIPSVTPIVSDKTLLVEPDSELVEVVESSMVRTTDLAAFEKVQKQSFLDRKLSELEGAIRTARKEKAEIREFAPQLFREISDDAAWGGREQGQWASLVEKLKSRDQALEARIRGFQSELKALRDQTESSTLPERSLGAAIQLTLLSRASLTVELQITYCVPCASWRPAHHVSVDRERLQFQSLCYLWQNTGEDWSQVELRLSTERTAQTTLLPRLSADRLSLRDRDEEVVLSAREEAVERLDQGEVSLVSTVPGIEDGGEVFSIAAPGLIDIPSDGQPVKVQLFEFEDVARFRHETKPEVLPQILLCSRQTNQSPYPLLPGPVELQKEGRVLGTSWLTFTASGASFELNWGACSGVTINRTFESREEKERLLKGWVRTERLVHLYLSNTTDQEKTLSVWERVPVSESSHLKVEVNRTYTYQAAQVDENGFIRWELTLQPHQRLKVPLSYTMDRRKSATVT